MNLERNEPYSGYTIGQLEIILCTHRRTLLRSGILEFVRKQYPFGNRYPLYNIDDINHWRKRLFRLHMLKRFNKVDKNTPLKHAPDYDDDDLACFYCGEFSVMHPDDDDNYFCPACGDVSISSFIDYHKTQEPDFQYSY